MSKPTLCLDTHELAWAAGFFDGEGSVCLRRRGNWRELRLQVPQSGNDATDILERFQRAIGGLGKIGGPWQYRERMLPMYRLDLYGHENVQAAISMVWRFLSKPKQIQATKAMTECAAYWQMRGLHGKGPAKLTMAQVAYVRERHVQAKANRQRVVRGWIQDEAAKLKISPHTLNHILQGRGYAT